MGLRTAYSQEYNKKRRAGNREAYNAQQKEYRDRNRDRINAQRRARGPKNTDKRRNAQLKTVYGITLDQYNQMLGEQNGLCAVCNLPETAIRLGKAQRLAVDHNHTTGQVRALLCTKCNAALGYLDENADRMRALAAYIMRFNNV